MSFSLTELQRLRYRQGQLLRSRDFCDQVEFAAQLRWWHNRALHNAFGVAEGLKVELNGDQVIIKPGVAYDGYGRELVLQQEKTLVLPTAAKGKLLLMRYKHTRAFPKKTDIGQVCGASTTGLLEEQPDFLWKVATQVELYEEVPLAKIIDSDYELDPEFYPPQARPLARPRIGSGNTVPGNTSWEEWSEIINGGKTPIGFQFKVNTSAVEFTDTPYYFAWLQRSSWNTKDSLLAPFSHIHEPTGSSFFFRLWLPKINVGDHGKANDMTLEQFLQLVQSQQLSICWLGIQPLPGRYPTVD